MLSLTKMQFLSIIVISHILRSILIHQGVPSIIAFNHTSIMHHLNGMHDSFIVPLS